MSNPTYVDLPDFVSDARPDPANPGLATAVVTDEDGERIEVEAVEIREGDGSVTLAEVETLEDFRNDPETGRKFAEMIRAQFEQPEDASVADLLTLLDLVCGGDEDDEL